MKAPNYDWIEHCTPVQKKFLQDTYPNFYLDYQTYGYSVVVYDYSTKMDSIYEEVNSIRITEAVKIPTELEKAVMNLFLANQSAGDLRYIVVPVPDYHIVAITDDSKVLSELKKSIRHVYVTNQDIVEDNLVKRGNVAVVIDDIGNKVDEDVYRTLELNCVPFIRRSTLGWNEAPLNVDAENILKKFVERYRPCKLLR